MRTTLYDEQDLFREHRALLRNYGRAQANCSEQLRSQALQIERLRVEAMRLRAEMIIRDTALAWACEDGGLPDTRSIRRWPRRATLGGRVRALLARLVPPRAALSVVPPVSSTGSAAPAADPPEPVIGKDPDDSEWLEASLITADLVICQTGCLSHGAYWRVQDHCKRTGKTCVLVEQPEMLRIVRIHAAPEGEVRIAAVRGETGTTPARTG